MANPFGGFVHTSPLSSLPHDATLTLASNCIRDTFGPTVQTVADCLQTRGGASTLAQIVAAIRGTCRRVWNEERERLVARVVVVAGDNKYKLHRARGPATSGYVVEVEPIRQALLILIQHSLVSVDITRGQKPTYRFLAHRARLLPRYPRYIEYGKKALDETAAALLEELLIHGRLLTVDAIVATVSRLHESSAAAAVKSEKYTLRQAVVESFHRLVLGAFIEKVPPLKKRGDDKEYEFEGDENNSNEKTIKVEEQDSTTKSKDGDDPAVLALLNQAPYRTVLSQNTCWRVNLDIFHQTSRAFNLGRLVAERFGHKVQSCGSMITAALRLSAHKKYVDRVNYEEQEAFTPDEIVNYLPRPVQQALEKKPGGILKSLSRALVEISHFTHPNVLEEVEEATAHPKGGKFAIATRQLVDHLRDRIYHQVSPFRGEIDGFSYSCCISRCRGLSRITQVVLDSHGEVAARICSILTEKGYLESDVIAEMAMVPAKDTREVRVTFVCFDP